MNNRVLKSLLLTSMLSLIVGCNGETPTESNTPAP